MRLYLDTNVIMDFLLDRHQPSTDLILRSIACAHELFVSDWTFTELQQQGLMTETQWFVAFCGRKLSVIVATHDDMLFARALPTHAQDALHYALARSCDALVMHNVRDFPFPRVVTPRDVK